MAPSSLLLIAVGPFRGTIAALLILFPILLQVAMTVGLDPVHFLVIAVLNLMTGVMPPPVGVCLLVATSIGKGSIGEVSTFGGRQIRHGAAIAGNPLGPYVKYLYHPISNSDHEICVWHQDGGIASLITTDGPEKKSLPNGRRMPSA